MGRPAGLVWDVDQPVDPARLAGVLDEPGVTRWSGIRVGSHESLAEAWLRLAVEDPGAMGLWAAREQLRAAGRPLPFLTATSMGMVADGSLGFLTQRRVDDGRGNGSGDGVELGARGVGPDGAELAGHVLAALDRWNTDRTAIPTLTLHPTGIPDRQLPPGNVVDKVHRRLVAAYA